MVSPIRIQDPQLNQAYVALGGKKTLDAQAAQTLIDAAKRDDGRLDATERRDLGRILEANHDAFEPAARSKLQDALRPDAGPRLGFDPRLLTAPSTPRPRDRPDPVVAQDNTRVVRPVVTERASPAPLSLPPGLSEAARAGLLQPPRAEFKQANPGDLERGRERQQRREVVERAQRNQNAMAEADPFAAQVNGMWQNPVTRDWEKVGPSPLEATSQYVFAGSVPGRIYGGITATKAVVEAAQDPTAGNVATAVFKVGLSGSAEWAKAVHAPIKPVLTGTKAAYNSKPHSAQEP